MPRRKKIDQPSEQIRKIKTPQIIKGLKDILPSDNKYWLKILDDLYQLAIDFNYSWIETPLFEKPELFSHTIGRKTELISRDMLVFQDKNEKLALRPDMTPGVARSFIEHSLFNQPGPLKFWFSSKIFSQGKYYNSKTRELQQVGFNVYNAPSHGVDAELVVMLYQYFVQINLNPIVRVNSLGCPVCRNEYLKALTGFIKSKRSAVCTDCRSNAGRDPIKFLQCASQKCQKVYEDAPQVVDYLCENCHNHLFKFLESLDEVGVSYVLDSRFISDFAYYNSTIYSIVSQLPISKETVEADVEVEVEVEKDNKEATAEEGDFVLAEGGRMNYLCEMLSGPEVPVAGIKLFVEKLISEIKRRKVELAPVRAPHVYLAQISEQAKRKAMSFLDELRREDLRVVANFSKDNLKSQLDTATKKGAKIILILGQREVVDGTILMRDVESGIQEVVSQKKIIEEVKKRLAEKQLKNR